MEAGEDLKVIHKIELDMLLEIDRICRENNLRYYLAYGTVLGAVRHGGFIPWDNDVDIMADYDNYQKICSIVQERLSDKYLLNSVVNDSSYEELFARVSPKNFRHQSIHVDIFPMAGVPRNILISRTFMGITFLVYRLYFVKKVDPKVNYKNKPWKKRVANIIKFFLLPVPAKFLYRIFNKLSTMFTVEDSEILYSLCGTYGNREFIPKEYLSEPVYFPFEGYKLPVPKDWDKYLKQIYGDYMTPKKR